MLIWVGWDGKAGPMCWDGVSSMVAVCCVGGYLVGFVCYIDQAVDVVELVWWSLVWLVVDVC